MNRHIATVIVAPLTTVGRAYPTRVPVVFQDRSGFVVLDQIRTVDSARLVRLLGRLDAPTADKVLAVLADMFAP